MTSFVPSVLFGSSGIHTTFLETAVAFANIHEYWAFFHVGGKMNYQLPFHEDTKRWCTKIRLYFYLFCYCIFLWQTQFTVAKITLVTPSVGKPSALWFPLHQTRKYNTETKGQIYVFTFFTLNIASVTEIRVLRSVDEWITVNCSML